MHGLSLLGVLFLFVIGAAAGTVTEATSNPQLTAFRIATGF